MSKQQCKILFSFFIYCSISGCTSFIESLFGTSTTLNTADRTPPTIEIVVSDLYVRQPTPGDFVVTGEDRLAYVPAMNIQVSAYGDDPDGVQFAEILDMTVVPSCWNVTPEEGARAISSTAVEVPGQRFEIPASSSVITTRIPIIQRVDLTHDDSRYFCPDDYPNLLSLTVSIRARAGNYGGQVTETATATLTTGQIPSRPTPPPTTCPPDTRLDDEGRCVPD